MIENFRACARANLFQLFIQSDNMQTQSYFQASQRTSIKMLFLLETKDCKCSANLMKLLLHVRHEPKINCDKRIL